MRISSAQIHTNAVSAMMKAQSDLAKTQNEVSTGIKVAKPSDDPVAMTQILRLLQKQSANEQYDANSTAATARLNQEEQGLEDTESVIQQISELAVKANNASLNESDRSAIVTQLTELKAQLMTVANQKDSNGEYLFSGYATATQPFATASSGSVAYAGVSATRNVQVSDSQYVADSDAGDAVFMHIAEGNGTFVTAANASNTGSGVMTSSLLSRSSWVADDYTITFNSGSWTVTDGSGSTVSTGTYTEGQAISFNGVQLNFTGTPADGDSFTVSPSASEDIFTTIDSLISTVGMGLNGDSDRAAYQNGINKVLTQLDQTETHILSMRTSVGVRLSSLDTADTSRQYSSDSITAELSTLRDADIVESSAKLSQQYITLQAAQSSYAKIAKLSLFDYL